jgi:hypothetical protein
MPTLDWSGKQAIIENSPEIEQWLGSVLGSEAEDLSRHDRWLCMICPRLALLRELLHVVGQGRQADRPSAEKVPR